LTRSEIAASRSRNAPMRAFGFSNKVKPAQK
jgi:hypothetical protein